MNAQQIIKVDKRIFKNKDADKMNLVVFIFLSPDCPLCKDYVPTINSLMANYDSLKVEFNTVFSGEMEEDTIKKFVSKFNLKLNVLIDKDFILSKKFGATITPEAVIVSNKMKVIYLGAIDNWVFELGRKRNVITQNFLIESINSSLKGEKIKLNKTQAIGCFIEY